MVDRKETTVSTTLAPAATNDMDDLKHDPSHIEDVVIARLTDEDLFNLSRESLSFNSKASFRIFLLMVVQGINQAGYGVDWSVIGGLNAFDTWHEYFHFATAGEKFATMNALMNAGGMCGAPFLTFADHIGRRGMNFVGNAIVIVAAILQAFANDLPMFMAGRFLLGFGSSLMSSPQYIAEVAPAHLRGRLVGIFGACFQVGSIVMTGAMLAFVDMDKAKNDWCWRIPLLLEAVCPAIVCITIFFLTPESPRFLIMRGKTEKARRVIAQYQTDSGDVNAPLVDHVFAQIEESLENDRVMNRQWWNFLVFFTRPVRYRFMLLVLYSFFQSWNGGGIISTYLRPALETVGISDTKDILGINLGLVVVYAVFTLVGALIIDHVNRRTLIFSGLISFILLQTAATVTGYKYDQEPSKVTAGLTVFWMFAFQVCSSTLIATMHNLYPVEILSLAIRAKGLALFAEIQAIAGIIMQYGISIGIDQLKYKIWAVFVAYNFIQLVVSYFAFPETRGLSLEEIDTVFQTPGVNPVKMSLDIRKAVVEKQRIDREAVDSAA